MFPFFVSVENKGQQLYLINKGSKPQIHNLEQDRDEKDKIKIISLSE